MKEMDYFLQVIKDKIITAILDRKCNSLKSHGTRVLLLICFTSFNVNTGNHEIHCHGNS